MKSAGLHHFHKRKRIFQKLEQYPHPDKMKRLMDHMIYFIGLIGPIMTLPQIATIWIDKNASGVSMITWATYLITSFFWLFYGIMHHEKPIMMTYTIWIFLEAFIVAGITMYN
jgi:uncharacterized protein with PQ loop repeat